MTKISVIIPVYNAEKYIANSLDSVLSQNFSDLEIICINDGSTDKSREILEQYQERDGRVKVISQKNSGGSAARNKGIEKSTGEYIMFLDSDDLYAKGIISEAYDRAIETDADIVFYNFTRFIGKPTKMATVNKTVPGKELTIFTKESYTDRFFNDFAIITWNKLVKKKVITDNNLQFNTKLSHNHDVDFSIRLMLAAKSYSWLNKIGYYYRSNDSGLTAIKRSDPTNVLKILVDLNKTIESDYSILKDSYDNYVADMIAGTILKYSNDKNKVKKVIDFSQSAVIPELNLGRNNISEPTGIFSIVHKGDAKAVYVHLDSPRRKIKVTGKYLYNFVQGVLAKITV